MTTDLILPSDGVEWTPVSVTVLDPELSFEDYQRIVAAAGAAGDAAKWWLGDLLLFGESRWPHEYAQVLEASRLSGRQVERYRYLAQQIRPPRRRGNLSFSHHEEVAALVPAVQDRLLGRAGDEGWTVAVLREAIRDERAIDKARRDPPRMEVLGAESVDAVRELGAVKATLAQVATAVTDADAAEALGLPRAIRAVEQIGRTVRQAAATLARTGLRDAAARVRAVAVKQGTSFPEPAYLVPAEALEALFSALDAEPVRTHEGGGR